MFGRTALATSTVVARTAFWVHPDGRYPLVFGGEHVLAGQVVELVDEAIPDAVAGGLVDLIDTPAPVPVHLTLVGDGPQDHAAAA